MRSITPLIDPALGHCPLIFLPFGPDVFDLLSYLSLSAHTKLSLIYRIKVYCQVHNCQRMDRGKQGILEWAIATFIFPIHMLRAYVCFNFIQWRQQFFGRHIHNNKSHTISFLSTTTQAHRHKTYHHIITFLLQQTKRMFYQCNCNSKIVLVVIPYPFII